MISEEVTPTGAPLGEGGADDVLSAVAVPPPGRSRLAAIARTILPPIIFGAVIVGFWYAVSYGVLSADRRFLLEPPHRVWLVGFADWANLSEQLKGLLSSARVAFLGLTISIVVGMVLAVIMSQAKSIERAMFPYMVTLQAIPILAIVPLIGFWFGFGFKSRVVVAVLISLFPIVVNTLFGLQSAERGAHDLFTLHHASRLTRLRKLTLPNALPAIFAGFRISAGLSVIGAIVGDFFFGQGDVGIGQLLRRYANFLQGEQLLSAVILSSLLGVAVFLAFGWIQDKVTGKWYEHGGQGI